MQRIKKAIFITLGVIFVILGLVGILTPILPTTPFLLLAAFFFARSSDRALQWLLHNRWFGVYIRNYREGRGMALRHKIITLSLLWATIGLSIIYAVEQWWLRLLLVGIAGGVTFHLTRLKNYRPERASNPQQSEIEFD